MIVGITKTTSYLIIRPELVLVVAQGRKVWRRNGYGSHLRPKRHGQRVRTMPGLDRTEKVFAVHRGESCFDKRIIVEILFDSSQQVMAAASDHGAGIIKRQSNCGDPCGM